MTKLLVLSDSGVPTGYGRIADEVLTRLSKRGFNVIAASLAYDGLLPPQFDGARLPYWVASLAGRDWMTETQKLIGAVNPDIVLVIQDAPYAQGLRAAPIDWSAHGFMVITPVDGVPIYPAWIDTLKSADAAMTISEFGVEAYRKAGVPVGLCKPGVNPQTFYKLPDGERLAIRERLGIAPDAFVVGTACMNQGRKAIPSMLKAFFDFASDKPTARYLLDMEELSPAGWDIRGLCQQFGWDARKLIFRADAQRAGVVELRDRFNVMDAHMVLAFREGYGLPLAEAMACGAVSIALDYCSGTEICGGGRGVLIPTAGDGLIGTWGGAVDYAPDVPATVRALSMLYDNPAERAVIAQRGMQAVQAWTWDAAADAVYNTLQKVIAKRASVPPRTMPPHALGGVA